MRILFLSQNTGGRCQMAEGLARQMFGDDVLAAACGIERCLISPIAVDVMREAGVDIAAQPVVPVKHLDPTAYDVVIVVSERDVSQGVLPHRVKRMHWPIMDPEVPPAPEAELRQRFRDVRMQLSKHLKGLGKIRKKVG